jgi:hypothetical protein
MIERARAHALSTRELMLRHALTRPELQIMDAGASWQFRDRST